MNEQFLISTKRESCGFASGKLYDYLQSVPLGTRKHTLLSMAFDHLRLLELEIMENIKTKSNNTKNHPPLVKKAVNFLGAIIIGYLAVIELSRDFMKRNDLSLNLNF